MFLPLNGQLFYFVISTYMKYSDFISRYNLLLFKLNAYMGTCIRTICLCLFFFIYVCSLFLFLYIYFIFKHFVNLDIQYTYCCNTLIVINYNHHIIFQLHFSFLINCCNTYFGIFPVLNISFV